MNRFFLAVVALLLAANINLNFASSKGVETSGVDGESFQSLAFNGSWNQFASPSAIYYNGKTYSGWIDNSGNITVGTYDNSSSEIETFVVKSNVSIDSRSNPTLLIDEKGVMSLFYYTSQCCQKGGTGSIYFVQSMVSGKITRWSEPKAIATTKHMSCSNSCKAGGFVSLDAVSVGSEYLLLWSDAEGQTFISQSANSGKSWGAPKPIFADNGVSLKLYGNGDDIHLSVGYNGSLYYAKYNNGKLYKIDGKSITIPQNGAAVCSIDLIYDATTAGDKSQVLDIAVDDSGSAVFAFAKYDGNGQHTYCYTTWSGKKWITNALASYSGSFVDAKEGVESCESNFSGGVSIDKEDVSQVYLSIKRDSIFEIEKWSTTNQGKSWKVNQITSGSEKNNIRPVAVVGAEDTNALQLMWMCNTTYFAPNYIPNSSLKFVERFQTAIKMGVQSPIVSDILDKEQILQIMRRTADWQFANPYDLSRYVEWHWATYMTGVEALYELTSDERYMQEMVNMGNGVGWRTHNQILYVDMIGILANWSWLYAHHKEPKMIEQGKWALDVHLATRRKYMADVRFANNPYFVEWWTWCDALFMAPPAFTAMYKHTGEKKYLDYMDQLYWVTVDYLYSPQDSLMFRDDRYFEQRTESGNKVFWSRGNGWVIGGLARVLSMMPSDYPSREKYEKLFVDMSLKLLSIQSADGGWRVSLLDPEYQNDAEMSGSAFFVYALAWGINNGLIDSKYRAQIETGWEKMCSNVNQNGRFGNVQSEGIDPHKFEPEHWHVYGTGAFLMAAAEIYKMVE